MAKDTRFEALVAAAEAAEATVTWSGDVVVIVASVDSYAQRLAKEAEVYPETAVRWLAGKAVGDKAARRLGAADERLRIGRRGRAAVGYREVWSARSRHGGD